jgi:hypothetical protein
MRINDLLIESTNQLDEGPKFNKFGQAIGNVAGMAAKGIGAVAGGIAGLGAAAKKGFQAGKSQVAATDDGAAPAGKPAAGGAAPAGKPAAGGGTSTQPKGFIAGVKAGQNQGLSAINDPNVIGSSSSGAGAAGEEDPAAGGAAAPAKSAGKPAAGGAAPATTPPSTTDINKAGPKGTAQAKPIQGTVAKQAAAKTGAALAGQDQAQAGQTMYSQVKANIDKLDKKGKQRILQLLQKSMAAPAAGGAAPAAGGAAPAKPAAGGAMGAMAGQLAKGGAAPNTMANAPVSKTNTAKPGNPNAAPGAAPAAAPSGEKTIANPVATVGTKRAANIGQQTFDTQTGKSLPGQALNNVRKKAEYGTNALGAARKKIKAGAAQPEMAGKINTGSMVLEGFSLFRKK